MVIVFDPLENSLHHIHTDAHLTYCYTLLHFILKPKNLPLVRHEPAQTQTKCRRSQIPLRSHAKSSKGSTSTPNPVPDPSPPTRRTPESHIHIHNFLPSRRIDPEVHLHCSHSARKKLRGPDQRPHPTTHPTGHENSRSFQGRFDHQSRKDGCPAFWPLDQVRRLKGGGNLMMGRMRR